MCIRARAAAARRRYATIGDLHRSVVQGEVIDTADCTDDLFNELVLWMDMLGEKSHARVTRERALQDESTRVHTSHCDPRTLTAVSSTPLTAPPTCL